MSPTLADLRTVGDLLYGEKDDVLSPCLREVEAAIIRVTKQLGEQYDRLVRTMVAEVRETFGVEYEEDTNA